MSDHRSTHPNVPNDSRNRNFEAGTALENALAVQVEARRKATAR